MSTATGNTDKNILFFTFGRENSEILAQTYTNNLKEQSQKAKDVKSQLVQITLEPEEQQKISTKTKSVWYCKYDKHEIYYILECGQSYPERLAYQFIREVQAQLATLTKFEEQDDSDLKFHCKNKVQDMIKKYNDLASIDKLSEAQANMDDVKLQMNDNINKVVGNGEVLNEMQGKSEALKNQTGAFKKQSKDLERIMKWRDMKLKIIITVVIFCILLIILIPIISKGASAIDSVSGDDDDEKKEDKKRILEAGIQNIQGFLPRGLQGFMANQNNNNSFFGQNFN